MCIQKMRQFWIRHELGVIVKRIWRINGLERIKKIRSNDVRLVHDAFLKKVKSGLKGFIARYPAFFSEAERNQIELQTTPASATVELLDILRTKTLSHKIYLLIDEYDQFTNELLSFHFADFKDIVSKNGYVHKFYEVLKELAMRGYIARIFMTGVAPVTVDSMTSGFNIVTDMSLRRRFHQMMGFVEAEVSQLLQKINLSEPQLTQILGDLRRWYDGYRFNMEESQHLYNPEMVLYFADYYQSEGQYPKKMLTANVAC